MKEYNTFFEDLRKKHEQEKIILKEVIFSTNYMNWLENFTLKYKNFADDSWLYRKDEISEENYNQVIKLQYLYQGIDDYAQKNYISSKSCPYGNFYQIKFKNVGFEIGIVYGQGSTCFVKRRNLKNFDECIDFANIMADKKVEEHDKIKYELNNLKEYIFKMYENGIPYEAISSGAFDALDEIKQKRKK